LEDEISPSKVLDWMRPPRINFEVRLTRKQQLKEDLESMDVDEHVTVKRIASNINCQPLNFEEHAEI